MRAARRWLAAESRAGSHPGNYDEAHEPQRDAGVQPPTPDWPEALADALIERQRPDGSWANPLTGQREDDPLVSTSFALVALAACRGQR